MPAKNSIKTYVEGGYYHIYNRGVNKQNIFFDDADFVYFIYLLKIYLSSPKTVTEELKKFSTICKYLPDNYYQKLYIVCFCLMQNHFHLIVHQTEARTLEHFMRSFTIKFSMYMKRKYNRCGHLFQDSYKGVLITHDSYLLHLSRYIHLNPIELSTPAESIKKKWASFADYPYSSYQWYLNNIHTEWFNPTVVLDFFNRKNIFVPRNVLSYGSFVSTFNSDLPDSLKEIAIDSEK
ncbi:MAG: transposase [Patescibacteria group bacterium]